MSQLTDEQLQNTNSVIANGLEAKKMRHKIENKDLLSQKGALYVGTGNTTSTGAAVTTSIAPNSETDDGKVLIANSTANEGWQIGKITASNIEDGAVSPTKLNLQSDYAVKTLTVHATDSLDEQFAKYTNTGIEYAGINDSFNTLVYPTELPDTTGTVATKEQIENGDIIAKSASYASTANATTINGKGISEIFNSDGTTVKKAKVAEVAQTTGFTNQNWTIVTSGSSEVEVRDSALYEILVDGLFIVVGGGVSTNRGRAFDIITTALSGSTVLKYFDVYDATISSIEYTSYLTVAKTRYEAKNLGGYMHWELGTRTQITDFRYRRIA